MSDVPMIDLFRTDLENQCQELNKGILALEKEGTDQKILEEVMRAAHSVKGAARVVGLAPVVAMTHQLEEVFVSLQKEKITLSPFFFDTLLSCVDLLEELRNQPSEKVEKWIIFNREIFEKKEGLLKKIVSKKGGSEELLDLKENVGRVPNSEKSIIKVAEAESVLRVTAQNLNRLMGLAGESLVESRRLFPFVNSLIGIKRKMLNLDHNLEQIRESDDPKDRVEELQRQFDEQRKELASCISDMEGFLRKNSNLSDRLYHEVIASRMRPFSDAIAGFPRMIRDVAKELGKKVELVLVGKETPVDRDILEKLEAPLGHLLRNAIDHAIERPEERIAQGKPEIGKIFLEASHRGGMLSMVVSDDGCGFDVEEIRKAVFEKGYLSSEMAEQLSDRELIEFIFLPGFSTRKKVSNVSGRGVGLDVLQAMVQEVGGTLNTTTQSGKGTTFTLRLPLTLSVVRTLIVEIAGEPYAFPLNRIDHVLQIGADEISELESMEYFERQGRSIGLVSAWQILGIETPLQKQEAYSVVVIGDEKRGFYGVIVGRIFGEKELVVQELDPLLGKVANVSSGACMDSGEPVLVLDVDDFLCSIEAIIEAGNLQKSRKNFEEKIGTTKRILVVDDSITVREMEARILRHAGYDVDVAVDGMDGWNLLKEGQYDLIVTDLDMPRMTGLEFTRMIRADPETKEIPIVVVSYKDRRRDRMAAKNAGANCCVSKSGFQDKGLVEAVRCLMRTDEEN